jgi:hydrogenase/urease accessory protein HupE
VSGNSATAVLPPDELSWLVPAEPTLLTVARDYIALGFRHIWEGPDHLLFVAGLLLLARVPRRILWAVTGFTAAHSLTLSLAALGIVRVPIEPVEAMIALSILFLAGEIARDDPSGFSSRFPVALSFVFGLLHGFGFASALGEVGLPRGELAAGLAFFNVGVEFGQLAFIAVIGALMVAWRLLRPRLPAGADARFAAAQVSLVGAYALGIPAAFWFIERMATAFGA